ncbi:MAG: ArsR family transcriptional regulator [Calditrichaeota bacterium]|nr:MAG: ArsR family transcriptional regulator [Calditrichota bacterium]
MKNDVKKLVKISKALADETRYKIFKKIAHEGEIPCKEIVNVFHVSQPTISHHLKVLVESGLVKARKDGAWNYFSVNKEALQGYFEAIRSEIIV